MKRINLLHGLTGLLLIVNFSCGSGKRISLVVDREKQRVQILADGELFTSYLYEKTLEKPVLYPVTAPGGLIVTRGFPIDPRAFERVDHPHQLGLWFNFGDVNGYDFWNNSYAVGSDQKAGYGRIIHREILDARVKRGTGILDVKAEWVAPDTENAVGLLEEHTTFRFRLQGEVRIIDRITRLTATGREVVFTDNKEGLMAIRVAREFEHPAESPAIHTDSSGIPSEVAVLDNTGVTGWYTNSNGVEGTDAWGKRAEWVRLTGKVEGQTCSIVIIDHPMNPGHPPCWHARGYGLFSVNNMGSGVFDNALEPFSMVLEDGQTAVFRHRLVIAGKELSREEIGLLNSEFREVQ